MGTSERVLISMWHMLGTKRANLKGRTLEHIQIMLSGTVCDDALTTDSVTRLILGDAGTASCAVWRPRRRIDAEPTSWLCVSAM